MVLAIVVPIIIQNAITNFVNLLDNIMVGQVGTEQMSGVSIANQLMFVFNLCVFGGISGAGIFSAQFHGANNQEGVRHCFRYKLYLCAVLIVAALAIFLGGGEFLINRFLHDEADPARIATTLSHGMDYLHVMLWGMLPFALTQVYASTLRECGETKLPMIAGIVAVFVNLAFNYLLIFGHLGFPRLGVRGAAIATVLSRFVELAIVVVGTHANTDRYRFVKGVYSSFRVPGDLAREITLKGMPLLVNEALWSMGMTVLVQCYSQRGLDVVAAMNISSTVSNLFSVAILSMGSATAIIVGQSLGANDMARAKDQAWKLIAFSLFLSAGTLVLDAAGRAADPPGLPDLRRRAPAGDPAAADLRPVPAADLLLQQRLFHTALRRQDADHLPVRQRLHLADQRAHRLVPGAPDRPAGGDHLSAGAAGRDHQVRLRLCAAAQGRMDEQHRGMKILLGCPGSGFPGLPAAADLCATC